MAPDSSVGLCTNAPVVGLAEDERAGYDFLIVAERPAMAGQLMASGTGIIVVDTAALPGLRALPGPLCLILRETIATRLDRFRLANGRPWDLLLVPNPPDWWLPPLEAVPARTVEAVGWIYRRPSACHGVAADARKRSPTILVSSGGGGAAARGFRDTVDPLIMPLRKAVNDPFTVVQVLGPRAPDVARLRSADRFLSPGPELHEYFANADLVVSTVGYNSVLELACTDVPVLMIPVARSIDDQAQRAQRWARQLGRHLDADMVGVVSWMAGVLNGRKRRAAVDLGPSGASRAAELILELSG